MYTTFSVLSIQIYLNCSSFLFRLIAVVVYSFLHDFCDAEHMYSEERLFDKQGKCNLSLVPISTRHWLEKQHFVLVRNVSKIIEPAVFLVLYATNALCRMEQMKHNVNIRALCNIVPMTNTPRI